MSYNTNLQTNNTNLQAILETINNLPEANDGVELPELTNPTSEAEVFEGYEAIDENGNKLTGTFTIVEELTTQEDLIAQALSLAQSKAIYNTIYIGSTEPTSDIGVDGDIYIVRSDA